MVIRTEDDLRCAVREIWSESMKILGEDPNVFPKDDRWVITNHENESFMQWNTGLTAIFRQGENYTIPVGVVWEMPKFYAWGSTDDAKLMRLWHGFTGFMLRILGDPKRIEGGLEFTGFMLHTFNDPKRTEGGLEYVGVVSPPSQTKTEEEPRWKQRRRNLRSDFPRK